MRESTFLKGYLKRRAEVIPIALLACLPVIHGARAATLQSALSLRSEQYATEATPGTRLDLRLGFFTRPDGEKIRPLPLQEAHFYSFYESGPGGDYSLDLDRTVERIPLSDFGHLWIGRSHPLAEATHEDYPTYVDAIGTNWVQNQSDALSPRVAGWIGLGGQVSDSTSGLSFSLAYSPLFLPSFGPRLQLSETSPAQGSRFSRLPPQGVDLGDGTVLPLRYSLHVGDIRRIVLQPQAFVSAGYENRTLRADLMDWTAPDPSADIDTDYGVRTHTGGSTPAQDSADVLVEARPRFRRQNFTGLRVEGKTLPARPLLTMAYEWFRRETTAALQLTPFSSFSLGVLHRWARASSVNPDTVISPAFANRLLWVEAHGTLWHDRIRPSLRLEKHLSSDNSGSLLEPELIYMAARKLELYAAGSIITGKDGSYFGNWRSLDSVSLGANWQW